MATGFIIRSSGDFESVEWNRQTADEGYGELITLVRQTCKDEWLDTFRVRVTVDGDNNPHYLQVWVSDSGLGDYNPKASELYNATTPEHFPHRIYGDVFIAETIGPDTVGLGEKVVAFLTAHCTSPSPLEVGEV